MSLSELSAAGVRLRPDEAAALVAEFCRQIIAGEIRGVPSLHVIRVSQDGSLSSEGPVGTDAATVSRAAQLLQALLAGDDAPPEFRAPGGLRLVAARATGAMDLPPFSGLEAFCASLLRFAAPDVRTVVRDLHAAYAAGALPERSLPQRAAVVLPAPMRRSESTISDVRRARRATGLTLSEIASRSHVPEDLLRELEWGYLRNWPGGRYGRSQMVRYARAAGLDERMVLGAAWPLLETAADSRGTAPQPALVSVAAAEPVHPALVVAPLQFPSTAESARPRRRGRALRVLSLAAAASVAAMLPAWLVVDHSGYDHRGRIAGPPPIVRGQDVELSRERAATAPHSRRPVTGVAESAEGPRVERTADVVRPAPDEGREAVYPASFADDGTALFFDQSGDTESAPSREPGSTNAVLKVTRVVADGAQNYHARPSPDGTRIAFDSDRDGTRAVYVANADGTEVRRVSGDGFAALPSWSPDGRRLAFARAEPDDPGVWNVWIANPAGGDLHRVTDFSHGQPWGASWFPGGTRIALGHDDALIVQDLASGRRRVFPSPVKGRAVRAPAVSPDGKRIVFQVRGDGTWLVDLATGNYRRVLGDPSAAQYAWSPDGRRVAFHSDRIGGWAIAVLSR